MMQKQRAKGQRESIFNNEVVSRFELYNSLFLTLPFYKVKDTGTLLPLFIKYCEDGINNHQTPATIIDAFFKKYTQNNSNKDIIDLLFRFIQYIERQVVLFDAVEDASFNKLNAADEHNALLSYLKKGIDNKALNDKIEKLIDEFSLRLVLTAHPTQFYPGSVLSIITDLTTALKTNDISTINLLLQQLGKTPFFNKKSPTPVDEALSLAWYLENVFYFAAANIQSEIDKSLNDYNLESKKIIELGFWPGGDRDGNPNVHTDSTIQVSKMLRQILFRCYYRDFRNLKRRITFRGVEEHIAIVQDVLYKNAFDPNIETENIADFLIENLNNIRATLMDDHDGLFADLASDLIRKVELYGSHFASLDIRQDSRVLRDVHAFCRQRKPIISLFPENYDSLSEAEKIKALSFKSARINYSENKDSLINDTLQTITEIKQIQESNGELACHRFIISNCQQASDILQLMELFLWNGWEETDLSIDFVPLFETVHDLADAGGIMETLYAHPFYKKHLKRRGNKQHIMLGFSDSTKDGGYLMANWSIFNAKVALTETANKHNIQLAFFDGRGGPPSRGGGKTHRFYASMGKEIANKNIQLTIQGQTISSQYGSIDSAEFNIEQLINAGISAGIKETHNILLDPLHKELLDVMAKESYEAFVDLRKHPLFLSYLEKFSPLSLLSKITISSRPVKRNSGGALKLEDLRAISFVTAWSQLKQNIPGFYGMGTALKNQEKLGNWDKVVKTYQESGYFKTIIDNCMMSMSKSDFAITAHFANDKEYGAFWKMLHDEFELSKSMLLKLSGHETLMENYPVEKRSIAVREKIVLPLVLIQHYALERLQTEITAEEQQSYEKLAIRTVYGIVNAGRNLA
ncbi:MULTISPECIES: phosphoenolpyruvate carboxylase [Pedobacter]|uniref:Phosphoenolpyruvate carboxylase n=1 Tax=Pedobacter heparinus (strain ATCC 13125 / DSM 2366 / CIP 104194 / JCM 7457 / NBRC 12017 / NCIMB 9290 / NRRL B-14731 / HIM 762-3) TaxID=485917 RepID=C6XXE8_PEDHD|nr:MULTISPECIES: phosphoenolpyruvate carboxylase [Pedobacter]ACU06454.1 Phosphoenolpyruvate carboxylase [Pedobacter heparinus DSM 2366]MBB5437176.1 phosphoenolpyruvate carboxylase [Pedobacter sp. AK017]